MRQSIAYIERVVILYWDVMVDLRVIIGPRENVLVGYFDVLLGEEGHLEV